MIFCIIHNYLNQPILYVPTYVIEGDAARGIEPVAPDEYVQDIIPYVLESKYPIVVTDEDKTIRGIILRVHVLASIISDSTEETELETEV